MRIAAANVRPRWGMPGAGAHWNAPDQKQAFACCLDAAVEPVSLD